MEPKSGSATLFKYNSKTVKRPLTALACRVCSRVAFCSYAPTVTHFHIVFFDSLCFERCILIQFTMRAWLKMTVVYSASIFFAFINKYVAGFQQYNLKISYKLFEPYPQLLSFKTFQNNFSNSVNVLIFMERAMFVVAAPVGQF